MLKDAYEKILNNKISVNNIKEIKNCIQRVLRKHLDDKDSDEIDKMIEEEAIFDEKLETQRFFEIVCKGKVSIEFANIKKKFRET